MVNGLCKKRYSRAFFEETTQGEDGYLVYHRWNDGRTFQKTPDGFAYDNRWVVHHNPYLTKMFNAHINVKVSASIRSVKYLFKYVYKGPDRVVAVIAGLINEIRVHFAYTTKKGDRGWKQAQRQGEDRVTLQITLLWPFEDMVIIKPIRTEMSWNPKP
jgi:hypothetical protein